VGVSALLLLAVVGAIALASRGGGGGSQQQAQTGSKSKATATATAAHTSAPDKKATATATQSPAPTTTTPPPTATPSVAAGSPDLAQARSLQLAGFNARRAGDYSTALAKAKAALAACGSTHQLDPCGYALFEEGAALNRGGDPAGAIPILQQRLSSYGDNASGEVSKELQDAQARAAGKPGKGKAKGKGKGGD
jgi:serine/threonine-protein kinase